MYDPVPADALSPQIYSLRPGELSHKVALELTTAFIRFLIRFTGGCGNLPADDAERMYHLFVDAFAGYQGAMVFGGTRMFYGVDPTRVRPGITEVPPMIRRANPESKMLGIVPVPEPPLEYNFQLGLVVSREPEYSTIVHPGQDYCLLVHASPDQGVIWDAEYRFCLEFTQMLRRFGNFGSLLVAYNGGNTTAKEIVATAGLGLPVLLIDGSGGAAERYARDADFRTAHPNVVSCDATTASLRQALIAHHALAN